MEVSKAALQSGIIVQEEGLSKQRLLKFFCKLCKVSFTDNIQIHIKNKAHVKLVTWEAISNASPSQYLLSTLPDIVRRAKQNGEVQAIDKNRFSYLCKVCSGKEPFCGLQQLQDHLSGESHNKSKNRTQTISPTQRSSISRSLSSQKVPDTNSTCSTLPGEVQILLANKTIQIKENNGIKSSFLCLVCNNLPMTGVKPLLQHVQSSKHTQRILVSDSSGSSLPPEVATLLRKGIIYIKESNGLKSSFICLVCNNLPMTGVDPLMQHVQSSKHEKKETENSNVDSDSRDLTPSKETMKLYPLEPSQDFPSDKKTGYTTIKNKNKKVVVLNYIKFPPPLTMRQGANKDSTNLEETFTNFGYDVDIHENLTAWATEEVLNRLQANTSMKCLILIILSHGQSKYNFYTGDGSIMDLDRIRKKFTDSACPQLKGLPKIVLANFCRGQDIELQVDASALIEVPHNMVTVHACVDNIQALRHPRDGTVFISSFCRVVEQNQDIQEILNKLHAKMKQEGGTTPMAETFFPFPKFTF